MRNAWLFLLLVVGVGGLLYCATGSEDAPPQTCVETSDCGGGHTCCDGFCRDLTSDPEHCGACRRNCGDGRCVDSECRGGGGECEPACPERLACCDGVCVDLWSDHDHCGACAGVCNQQEECVNAICVDRGLLCDPECTLPEECCDGECANVQTDPFHCGSCENECPAGQACSSGVCFECAGGPCAAGEACCDDECVDLDRDEDHCGACGNECGSGLDCTDGECLCDGAECEEGEGCCSRECVDLDGDPENCGRCGNDCTTQGGDTCASGTCRCGGGALCPVRDPCVPLLSQICCDGRCVPVNADNCGACGERCGVDIPCFVNMEGSCSCLGM